MTILRTPTLLAIFAKDPISATYSQGALRTLAMLEPGLIMPEILERAYSGLELVNETHRTTAVLTALASGALPLVSEKVWLGGQKHIAPLLELCIPGIDLVSQRLGIICLITAQFISSLERPFEDCMYFNVHCVGRAAHEDRRFIYATRRRTAFWRHCRRLNGR